LLDNSFLFDIIQTRWFR